MNLFFVSLGCDKNLVDSEKMIALLASQNISVTSTPEDAEIIIVNTCGFIHDAKEESIETILEMAEYKKTGKCVSLIMTGCLAQRYADDIQKEIPEVDAVVGTTAYDRIFEVVKENIVSVLRTVVHQKTLESIVRKDLFTGLYSEEYLYGEGKKVIDKYTTSTVCMYRITNIEEINDKYSRKLGNQVIIETSDFIRKSISNDYIYIRYMGPKFVIVFSGVDIDSVTTFITDMKNGTEELEISLPVDNEVEEVEMEAVDRKNKKKNKKEQEPQVVKAKLNFVLTTYYKGTGMEEVLKKLEQYVDNCDKSENDITFI